MSSYTIILILGCIILIALIVLIASSVYLKQVKKAPALHIKSRGRSTIYLRIYKVLTRFPITRNYVVLIKKRIEMVDLSDQFTIQKRTVKVSCFGLLVTLFSFIVVCLLRPTVYLLVLSLLTIYIIHNQIIYLLLEKMEDQLLVQFEKFLGDIRHFYHEHGMVDEAIYDALENSPYEISLHGHKMYEIISSQDVEEELEKYYDVIPNKYFKIFLTLCYTTQKFGDQVVDGSSIFLSNLNYLKQEMNLEILRRKKLNYLFKSLSILAVIPMFFLVPIEKWAVDNLPELQKYYIGAYGLISQVIICFFVLVSYQLICNMHRKNTQSKKLEASLEKRILAIGWIHQLIDQLIYKHYSKYSKQSKILDSTGAGISLELYYMKRVLYAIIGFLVTLGLFLQIHSLTKYNILHTLSDQKYSYQEEINSESEQQLLQLENKYILGNLKEESTFQTIEAALEEDETVPPSVDLARLSKSILNKIQIYKAQYLKWWEVTICFFVSILFFNIPYGILLFRKKVVAINLEDEVLQFHTIILMLMHIERMSVEDLLQWMELFSIYFQSSISKCLNNFENGDYNALEQLKIDEPFEPFIRIVENLQSATDKISIVQAFDELAIERGYYQEKRKQDNEISIAKKGAWGRILAFTPLSITIILYLLFPFIHFSVQQFFTYSSQINGSL